MQYALLADQKMFQRNAFRTFITTTLVVSSKLWHVCIANFQKRDIFCKEKLSVSVHQKSALHAA